MPVTGSAIVSTGYCHLLLVMIDFPRETNRGSVRGRIAVSSYYPRANFSRFWADNYQGEREGVSLAASTVRGEIAETKAGRAQGLFSLTKTIKDGARRRVYKA
jgi:hypothetical protein